MAEVTSPATKWVNEAPGSHDQRVSTDVFGTGIFGVGKFSEKDRTRTNWTRVVQALSSLILAAGLSTMAAADIFTTNLQLRKPTVGVEDPVTSWGDKYNANLDIQEAAICDKRIGCTIVGGVVVQGTVTTTGNAFSVGGSTLVVKEGQVGIGTASPAHLLHVEGGAVGAGDGIRIKHPDNTNPGSHAELLLISGGNSGGDARIRFDSVGTVWAIGPDQTDADKFKIDSGGALGVDNDFVIDASGNVGIGTASPARRLNVVDTVTPQIRVNNSAGSAELELVGTGSGTGGQVSFLSDGGDWAIGTGFTDRDELTIRDLAGGARLHIDDSGLVGIGTTDPGVLFDVVGGSIIVRGATAGLHIHEGGDAIPFRVGDSTLTVTNGRVGVGTASPTDTLDVDGTVLFSTSTNTDSDAMTIAAGVTTFNDDGKLRDFLIKDGNGASAFFMQSTNGDIGIGTASPTESIHTTGGIKFTGAVSMTNPLVNAAYADYASNNMRLLCSGPDATTRCGFRILTRESDLGNTITAFEIQADGEVVIAQDGGNVGIGTETPDALLDVEGSAAFGSGATKSTFTTTGHLNVSGTAPVTSACGTSPAVSGTDMAGKATIGTTVTTSCTLTFATAYTNAPACTIAGDNTAVTYAATTTTTVLTITSSADMDSDVISYICIGI